MFKFQRCYQGPEGVKRKVGVAYFFFSLGLRITKQKNGNEIGIWTEKS